MKKAIYFFSLVFLFCQSFSAKSNFILSPEIEEAYRQCISYELDSARVSLDQIALHDSDNLLRYHIENYIDFFRLFINEEHDDYEKSYPQKSNRLKAIRSGNKQSPYYRFSQAEILLQWALIELKFDDFVTALIDIKKAYSLLERNQELFPDFIANKKSLGVLHAILSTVPPQYKKGFEWLSGMKGNILLGINEIESVLEFSENNNFLFADETIAIYAYLQLHLLNKPQSAWQYINQTHIANLAHPMSIFVMSNIAMRSGHNEDAIQILNQRFAFKSADNFHFLHLLHGIALLNRLDPQAEKFLLLFIHQYKGGNYIKEAYQKLAWYNIIFHSADKYFHYMNLCKKNGKKQIDEDKAAHLESTINQLPNKTLLKGRLLFDGGYYRKALDIIIKDSYQITSKTKFHEEYNYRLGRINQALGQESIALSYFQNCVEINSENQSHWACHAALQSGLIYEKQKNIDLARSYFDHCLSLKPKHYASSLHQKAKAGLNRINP